MYPITRFGLNALFIATALVLSTPASALTYEVMSDEALLQQSEGIARVRVAQRLPNEDGDQETRYVLRVDRVVAGNLPQTRLVLALPGTFDSPTANVIVPGIPKLPVDQPLLLFFSARSDGVIQPQQLTIGLFAEVSSDTGPVYVRYMDSSSKAIGKLDALSRFNAPRAVNAFENWIRLSRLGHHTAADYYRSKANIENTKFTFSNFNFPSPGPGRWFQFDTNQTLNWTARPDGQTGMVTDEFQQFQQALATWTNDGNSHILTTYSGTANAALSCGNSSDPGCFSAHVKWNDPDNEISGSFSCSSGGVLGFGGSSAFSNGQQFAGQTWYPRGRGFMVVQDGAGCSLDRNNGANGIEFFAHEIGHALAFGHSCVRSTPAEANVPNCETGTALDEAVMRSLLHGDGRGGTLGTDDQAAAAIAYPESAPSNVGPTLSASSPANGSTTALSGGTVGAQVSGNISFNKSGGSGSGTTSLSCSVSSGTVTIASGSPQNVTIAGSVNPVVARFTLTAAAQSGTIACTATPQGGTAASFSYNFTAPAGTAACTGTCVFRNGFE